MTVGTRTTLQTFGSPRSMPSVNGAVFRHRCRRSWLGGRDDQLAGSPRRSFDLDQQSYLSFSHTSATLTPSLNCPGATNRAAVTIPLGVLSRKYILDLSRLRYIVHGWRF